jgi:molybdenum cofactor biosynthesis protein B
LIELLLSNIGHRVVSRVLISDSQRELSREIKRAARLPKVDSIVVCGGTGITRKDVTIEVAERLLDKRIPGFGEMFRRLSFDEVGSAAILTRALAGVVDGKVLFCLPGSINAVRLAMSRLILPEIGHMVKHASE